MKCKPAMNLDRQVIGHLISCPGCGCHHLFNNAQHPARTGASWTFNGNLEKPSFSPSMLIMVHDGWTKIPDDQWMPIRSPVLDETVEVSVPFAMLPPEMAIANHAQDLPWLRDHGGLTFYQALCLITRAPLGTPVPESECRTEVHRLCDAYFETLPKTVVCHSVVTDGRIAFQDDSPHHLRGKTVDLPDIHPGTD